MIHASRTQHSRPLGKIATSPRTTRPSLACDLIAPHVRDRVRVQEPDERLGSCCHVAERSIVESLDARVARLTSTTSASALGRLTQDRPLSTQIKEYRETLLRRAGRLRSHTPRGALMRPGFPSCPVLVDVHSVAAAQVDAVLASRYGGWWPVRETGAQASEVKRRPRVGVRYPRTKAAGCARRPDFGLLTG